MASAPLLVEATANFPPLTSLTSLICPLSIRSLRTVTREKSKPLTLEPLPATILRDTPRSMALRRPVLMVHPATSSSPAARGAIMVGPDWKGVTWTSSPSSRKYPFSMAMYTPASDTGPGDPNFTVVTLAGAVGRAAAGVGLAAGVAWAAAVGLGAACVAAAGGFVGVGVGAAAGAQAARPIVRTSISNPNTVFICLLDLISSSKILLASDP